MSYLVVVAHSAEEQFQKLDARWRSALKRALRKHLETAPAKQSKSRIKRLRGLRQPQYCLRVDEMRVFHDINAQEKRVEVLGFVKKPQTFQWLQDYGAPQ
jgi:mRNA-degrading endonuclease RelE of RelBE toxin-antitoxin system